MSTTYSNKSAGMARLLFNIVDNLPDFVPARDKATLAKAITKSYVRGGSLQDANVSDEDIMQYHAMADEILQELKGASLKGASLTKPYVTPKPAWISNREHILKGPIAPEVKPEQLKSASLTNSIPKWVENLASWQKAGGGRVGVTPESSIMGVNDQIRQKELDSLKSASNTKNEKPAWLANREALFGPTK